MQSEVLVSSEGLLMVPNRLFVSRSSTPLASPRRASSAKSCPEEALVGVVDHLEFGLAWLNLTYSPKKFMSNETKTIIRNISGQIRFGQILALMGPSGAGKSTLLRCINGRIGNGLSAETEIYISNRRSIHSCFIVQDQKEHLLMNLTVRESLLYASKIKNHFPSDNDSDSFDSDLYKSNNGIFSTTFLNNGLTRNSNQKFDHNYNINKLLTDLNINDCANTLIDDCSGGQQKRIVIGLELVGEEKPNILCIDEPTSGLDSNAAEQVIECLRSVSRFHSLGIITTIHQPNSDILSMFDSLYVLAKGGYCIYDGRPDMLRSFLKVSGIRISETQVPIEVMMKMASKTTFKSGDSEEFEVDEEVRALANRTKYSEDMRNRCKLFGKLSDAKQINIPSIGFNFIDFWYLIQRSIKCQVIRGWKSILFITSFELVAGLCFALLLGKTGVTDGCLPFNPYLPIPQNMTSAPADPVNQINEEQQTIQNFKFLFFNLLTHNFLQVCFTVLTFPLEVKIFFNEQQNRWYSSGSYFWAKNLVDAFIGIFVTSIYMASTYLSTAQIGMVYEMRFGYYLLSNILGTFCAQAMSYTFSIIAPKNLKACLVMSIGGQLVNTIYCGFLLPVSQMNALMQSLSFLSYGKSAFETQIFAIYGFDRCDPKLNRWSSVLYQMNVKEESFSVNILLLVIQSIVWRIIALVCLIIKTNDYKINFNFMNEKRKNKIQSELSLNTNDQGV